MENVRVLRAMWKFIENNGCAWEEIKKSTTKWFDANEWSELLDMTITSQRLASMYKQGFVVRCQDKKYYGNNNYHYFPAVRPDNLWE